MRRTILATACCLAVAGCDFNSDTDNGQVEVANHTDDRIVVRYQREESACDGCVEVVRAMAEIPAGEERTLFVDSWMFDGELEVEYRGLLHLYDVDFNVFGFAEVDVRTEDFVPAGSG